MPHILEVTYVSLQESIRRCAKKSPWRFWGAMSMFHASRLYITWLAVTCKLCMVDGCRYIQYSSPFCLFLPYLPSDRSSFLIFNGELATSNMMFLTSGAYYEINGASAGHPPLQNSSLILFKSYLGSGSSNYILFPIFDWQELLVTLSQLFENRLI